MQNQARHPRCLGTAHSTKVLWVRLVAPPAGRPVGAWFGVSGTSARLVEQVAVVDAADIASLRVSVVVAHAASSPVAARVGRAAQEQHVE